MIYTNPGVLIAQLAQPPTGKSYVTVADLPWPVGSRSVLEGASPAAVAGNVIENDTTTTPSGFGVTMRPDGTLALETDDGFSEQTLEYRLWRYNYWVGPETVTLEGEAIPFPSISGGGRLVGIGFEPPPGGDTGTFKFTAPGVLEDEERLFGGFGLVTGSGVLVGLARGRSIGRITGNGSLVGSGEMPVTSRAQGVLTAGGRIRGKGRSDIWTTIYKADAIWVKIRS